VPPTQPAVVKFQTTDPPPIPLSPLPPPPHSPCLFFLARIVQSFVTRGALGSQNSSIVEHRPYIMQGRHVLSNYINRRGTMETLSSIYCRITVRKRLVRNFSMEGRSGGEPHNRHKLVKSVHKSASQKVNVTRAILALNDKNGNSICKWQLWNIVLLQTMYLYGDADR
jgi:hypothetical protein